MPDGLYERDFLAWSEHQSALLRRLAAGERLNESIDWPNVIEEMEDLGRSELKSCESLLVLALVHLIKLQAWPSSSASFHWQGEVAAFLSGARRRLTPSMRQRIDLTEMYADALGQFEQSNDDSGPPLSIAPACPYTLDDLLNARPDIRALAAKLAPL